MFSRLADRLLGPIRIRSNACLRHLDPLKMPKQGDHETQVNEAILFRGSAQEYALSFGFPIKKIVGGIDHIMFLLHDGRIFGWGSNAYGQLGIDIQRPLDLWGALRSDADLDEVFDEPVELSTLDGEGGCNAIDIAAGHFTTFAVSGKDNCLYGWGAGILGNGEEHYDSRPQKIDRLKDIVSVQAWRDLVLAKDHNLGSFVFGATLDSPFKSLLPFQCALDSLPSMTTEYPQAPIYYAAHQTATNCAEIAAHISTKTEGDENCPYRNYNYMVYYQRCGPRAGTAA